MKKLLALTAAMLLLGLAAPARAATPPTPEVKALDAGEMWVYDYGDVKLHVYLTGDAIADVSFLLETETSLIALEAPAFVASLDVYTDYIAQTGKPLEHVLLSYHPTGATYYEGTEVYGTKEAQAAHADGGSIKALTEGFVETFGDAFDGDVTPITTLIEPGTVTIGGLEFAITATTEAYDVEIPAIHSVYTHMMGSDVHNILTGVDSIDAMIAQLKGYQDKDYDLILTSHYAPETIDAVAVKVDYLERTKAIIEESDDAEAFLAAMRAAFPNYQGENYLEMSAGILFP